MKDFIASLANEDLVNLSADLQVQLEKGTATRPVLWLLCRSRARAVSALRMLADVNVTKAADIITLQAQVHSYGEMMEDCQALLNRGRDADLQLAEDERMNIADALDPEEARALGLDKTPEDT